MEPQWIEESRRNNQSPQAPFLRLGIGTFFFLPNLNFH
jgi:hypothetical protein